MTHTSKATRGVDREYGNASHWCPVSSHPHMPAKVVLLCGPSGSGKSLLAARSGLPVLRLDDFYKDGDDPTLPLVTNSADIDWDHPDSWDADTAVTA
ncbi:MAG TPA: uridine kinase, partial [Streptomyces sp.]|nr:uridine kinase [Streptomyces sp.]